MNSCVLNLGGSLTITVACLMAPAPAQSESAPPDFSIGWGVGWASANGNGADFSPVPGAPLPVTTDPAHPYVPNVFNGAGRQPTFRIGDVTNPNLKPWVREEMKKDNEEVLAGKPAFMARSSCMPAGVLGFMAFGGGDEPIYFVQTPKEVWMIYQGNQEVRRIYLDVPHSHNTKPSWYGESVGHYEGDTLVIDTIGQKKETFLDFYRTPHTATSSMSLSAGKRPTTAGSSRSSSRWTIRTPFMRHGPQHDVGGVQTTQWSRNRAPKTISISTGTFRSLTGRIFSMPSEERSPHAQDLFDDYRPVRRCDNHLCVPKSGVRHCFLPRLQHQHAYRLFSFHRLCARRCDRREPIGAITPILRTLVEHVTFRERDRSGTPGCASDCRRRRDTPSLPTCEGGRMRSRSDPKEGGPDAGPDRRHWRAPPCARPNHFPQPHCE